MGKMSKEFMHFFVNRPIMGCSKIKSERTKHPGESAFISDAITKAEPALDVGVLCHPPAEVTFTERHDVMLASLHRGFRRPSPWVLVSSPPPPRHHHLWLLSIPDNSRYILVHVWIYWKIKKSFRSHKIPVNKPTRIFDLTLEPAVFA